TCQRCMGTVAVPLEVDQWYRFVASEDIAMAQDDESEEDLLVMEPQFDLLAVLEDELLMALPLVPMHEECPVAPVLKTGEDALTAEAAEKPNPFAVLAQLKKKK
ncbi:MAG: YceD family protein, partial [Polaromonas sp.]